MSSILFLPDPFSRSKGCDVWRPRVLFLLHQTPVSKPTRPLPPQPHPCPNRDNNCHCTEPPTPRFSCECRTSAAWLLLLFIGLWCKFTSFQTFLGVSIRQAMYDTPLLRFSGHLANLRVSATESFSFFRNTDAFICGDIFRDTLLFF